MNLTFKEAFKDSIPIMAGYIVLGSGFGIVASSYNYNILVPICMSLFIYAGSMEYLTLSLLSMGTSLINAAIMTVVVNLRHMFYGIAMLSKYNNLKKHKAYTIFSLTDETFSVVVSKKLNDDLNSDEYYFYISLLDQFYWLVGTIIGYLIGNILPFSSEGVDFSMTALFICVVIGQWEENKNHFPTIIGFVVSIICLLIFGGSNFLIPSIFLICLILIFTRGKNNG